MQLPLLLQPLGIQQRVLVGQLLKCGNHLMVVGIRSPEDTNGQQRDGKLRLLRNGLRPAQHIADPHAGQPIDYGDVPRFQRPHILGASAFDLADLRHLDLNLLRIIHHRIPVTDSSLIEAHEGHAAHAFVTLDVVHDTGHRLLRISARAGNTRSWHRAAP